MQRVKRLSWIFLLTLLWVVISPQTLQALTPSPRPVAAPLVVSYAPLPTARYDAILLPTENQDPIHKWPIASGGTVTYSFVTAANAPQYPGLDPSKIAPVPPETARYVTEILEDIYAAIIPVHFQQVPDTNDPAQTANIRVMLYDDQSGTYAAAYYPNLYGDSLDGDVYLYTGGGDWTRGPGSLEYATLLHELGHAMGLKHPGSYSASDPAPYLPPTQDNLINTVMSYNVDKTLMTEPSFWNWSLMPYDIAALQKLYGVNHRFHAGDTVYRLNGDGTTHYSYTSNHRQFRATQAIWDAGGVDTIDGSALATNAAGYVFDLRPGGQLTTQDDLNAGRYTLFTPADQPELNTEQFPCSRFATVMGLDVQIENLIGSSSPDLILGNRAANHLVGGAGSDRLDGGSGDDRLEGGMGNDLLIASAGADQLQGGQGNDQYQVDVDQAAGTRIHDQEGQDQLILTRGLTTLDLATAAMALIREGQNLVIDLNHDQRADASADLTIANFFTANGTIEAIAGWSPRDIKHHLQR